jgi:hypothetical protein
LPAIPALLIVLLLPALPSRAPDPPAGFRLPFDAFDTQARARPAWLALPEIPFLEPDRRADDPIAVAFDPHPIGPRQTFGGSYVAWSPLEPSFLGSPERLHREEDVLVAEAAAPPPERDGAQPDALAAAPLDLAWHPLNPSPVGPVAQLQPERPVGGAEPPGAPSPGPEARQVAWSPLDPAPLGPAPALRRHAEAGEEPTSPSPRQAPLVLAWSPLDPAPLGPPTPRPEEERADAPSPGHPEPLVVAWSPFDPAPLSPPGPLHRKADALVSEIPAAQTTGSVAPASARPRRPAPREPTVILRRRY